jgi:thiamine-phosphate pyrophosphorylase
MKLAPKVILITDPRYAIEDVITTIEASSAALSPYDLLVQLRDRANHPNEAAARTLRDATRRCRTSFIINGDVALARAVAADGVHLGGSRPNVATARALLGTDAWISIAAHTDDDVAYALAETANAVLVSPIFETPGKGAARGVEAITSARAIARDRLLVYALGGVDARRAAACAAAGADGVAVIRALLDVRAHTRGRDSPADARVSALALASPFTNRKRR